VGAGGSYAPNDTGGADSVTLTEDQMPSHNHSMNSAGNHDHGGSTSTDGAHSHTNGFGGSIGGRGSNAANINPVYQQVNTGVAGNHNHSISTDGDHTHTINNTGGGQSHENRPPYFALAFIMKL